MQTPEDRWARILDEPCNPAGRWVVLPENAWGAVMAFAAGPGHARTHDVPRERRTVLVTTTSVGVTRSRAEPMSVDDLAAIADVIDTILAEAHIPRSPGTWWEIDLPAGTTGDAVDEALDAAQRAGDTSGLDGPARTRFEAEVLTAIVGGWFGRVRR